MIDSLAAYLSRLGLRQLHVAETEKYAHVTYFFNGGVEAPLPGEDRVLVPSRRDVPTYDLAPRDERAGPITDAAAGRPSAQATTTSSSSTTPTRTWSATPGVWERGGARRGGDRRLPGRLSRATLAAGGALVITADHGNIEEMRDAAGAPQTKHTTVAGPAGAGGGALARGQPARRRAGRRGADRLRADGHPARARP